MLRVMLGFLCGMFLCGSAVAAPMTGVLPAKGAPGSPASAQEQFRPVGSGPTMQEAIDYYFKILPPASMSQEVLITIPLGVREKVASSLSESFFRRHVGNALEKTFTPSEIYAMAHFFGSPEGRNVMKKYPVFMKEIVEQIGRASCRERV